ncbi:MAG: hypothetical protein IJ545_03500 [Alphaproteobacteria bacterium]|nr:hypothetical protein [Alphaproteobacteria bacterium]
MAEEKIDENFTGVVKEYFDEEKNFLRSETPYKNGQIEGVVKIYQFTDDPRCMSLEELDGSFGKGVVRLKSETPYENGQKHGIETTYWDVKFSCDVNGEEIEQSKTPYVNGQKHGVEELYDPRGDLWCKVPYVEGKKQGIQKEHKGDDVFIETPFCNDMENGLRKIETGFGSHLETVNFVDGKKQGLEVETEQGSLERVTNYKDDKKQGFEVNCDWWTNSIEEIKTFSEDKQDGKTYLFEDGDVVQVDEYSKGELVSSKNDRLTLAKARIKEIPKILEQVCDGAANSKEKEKIRNQMQYRGYKLEPSGVVINDEAVKEGVSLQKPVKTEKLQQMISDKLLDDFLNS